KVSIQKLEEKARELGISLFESVDYVDLRPQALNGLKDFKKLIEDIKDAFFAMNDLQEIMPVLMNLTGYIDMLKAENSEQADDRIDNLRELQSVFVRGDMYYEGSFYEKLRQQLDQISLYSDLDQQQLEDTSRVKLATYHQVKGLEFRAVFMVVLEEGIFPNNNAMMNTNELEEERRVAYVGMTRAKEKLYMTYANRRMQYGELRIGYPSRFIKESQLIEDKPKQTAFNFQTISDGHILKTGDKVNHDVFGEGIVVSVNEDVAKIAFAMPHGIKNILESHPALKKVR
ncbi:MAG: 3'-5' exonuclease, partial [Acholeplasmataceae bacterium]